MRSTTTDHEQSAKLALRDAQGQNSDVAQAHIARAQVYATLALAAATEQVAVR